MPSELGKYLNLTFCSKWDIACTVESVRGRRFRTNGCGRAVAPEGGVPMNTFTMKDILEILQAAQPVLPIVKQLLEIRRDYKRWRMEQRK